MTSEEIAYVNSGVGHKQGCNCFECSTDSVEAYGVSNVPRMGNAVEAFKKQTVYKQGGAILKTAYPGDLLGTISNISLPWITFSDGSYVANIPENLAPYTPLSLGQAIQGAVNTPAGQAATLTALKGAMVANPAGTAGLAVVEGTAKTGVAVGDFVSGNWKFILIALVVIIVGIAIIKIS